MWQLSITQLEVEMTHSLPPDPPAIVETVNHAQEAANEAAQRAAEEDRANVRQQEEAARAQQQSGQR